MNFYKKITIGIFSILVVFGISAGISSAFIGPDPGQNPGTGSGLFYVDPDRNIGFGTESPSIGNNAEGSPWGYTFTVASSSNPGLSLLNTSASGRHYSFYSNDSGSFGLFDGTAGSVRLRVDSSGNVSVGGTNTAQSLFHVFGGAQATSFAGSGINLTNIDPQNFIAGSSFNSGNYAVDGSLAVGTSTVTAPGTDGLYVDGYIGIGETDPASDFVIRADTNTVNDDNAMEIYDSDGILRSNIRVDGVQKWYMKNTNGEIGQIEFSTPQNQPGIVFFDDEGLSRTEFKAGEGGGFIVATHSGGSPPPERFRVAADGNIGIGTSTPPRLFSVDASGSGIVSAEFSNSGGHLIDLKSTSDYNGIRFYNDGNNGKNITYIPDGDYLQIGSSWSSGGEELVVKGDGDVGIGTTTTPSKLTVNGGIESLSGGVTFPDGTTQTTAGGGGGDSVGWDRDDGNGYVILATSTDSVGIGDSTPSAKLDVNGSIYGSTIYDKDNTSYYVNPSANSNVRGIKTSNGIELDSTSHNYFATGRSIGLVSNHFGNELWMADKIHTVNVSGDVSSNNGVFRYGESYSRLNGGIVTWEILGSWSNTTSVNSRRVFITPHNNYNGDLQIEIKRSDDTWATAFNDSVSLNKDVHFYDFSNVAPYPDAWNIKGIRFTFSNYTAGDPYITQLGLTNVQGRDTFEYVGRDGGSVYANINLNSNKITNLASPTAEMDAATKNYVDSTAGGGVPSGSDGQTLYNNAGDWAATSNLYNNGSNIGINTTSPDAMMDIHNGDLMITNDTGTGGDGKASIVFNETSNGVAHSRITYHGDDVNGDDNYLGFDVCSGCTKDSSTLAITRDDQVGIGDITPGAKLDVNGSIYGSTYYDKDNTSYYVNPSGATSALLAGDVGIRSTNTSLSSTAANLFIDNPANHYGIVIDRGVNDPDMPAGLLISGDNDGTDDIAIEVRGNSDGTSVDNPTWGANASSSDSQFVVFMDGTTVLGKSNVGDQYSAGGILDLGGRIDMNSNRIINLASPTAEMDAATKNYVDSTAGGGVPSGSDGQTLYNNAGDWAATSNLYNNGTDVGIGTTNPGAGLDVRNTGTIGKFEHNADSGNYNSVVLNNQFDRDIGLAFQNQGTEQWSIWNDGAETTNNRLHISSSARTNRLTILQNGNVGISDATPSAKLDINGSIYGSLFYDKDNTSFYVNPSGSGNSAILNGNVGIGTTGVEGARYGTGGKRVEVKESNNGEIAQLLVQGGSQGTGYIYVGQSSTYGGGITYNGDDTPDMPHNSDDISIFRRTGGTDHEVLSWAHNNDRAEFRGPIDSNGSSIYGATFYDSNNTTYYTNPSGTSNINGLTVNGNWTLSGGAQADVNMNNNDLVGVNKITVGTIDPLYKINGQKYATYVPDTIGLKTEIYGKADLQKEFTGKESPKFSHTIDFDQVEEGSDLWLFWKTISLKDDMSDMIVNLTPEGSNADIWYELDSNENQLVIHSDKLATVSYHLVAPRHDSDEWPTKTDTEEEPSFIFEEGKWIK